MYGRKETDRCGLSISQSLSLIRQNEIACEIERVIAGRDRRESRVSSCIHAEFGRGGWGWRGPPPPRHTLSVNWDERVSLSGRVEGRRGNRFRLPQSGKGRRFAEWKVREYLRDIA